MEKYRTRKKPKGKKAGNLSARAQYLSKGYWCVIGHDSFYFFVYDERFH
jgi:hypothetical protein